MCSPWPTICDFRSSGRQESCRCAERLPIDPKRCIIMAELATTPWLYDAAQAAQKYEEAAAVATEACAEDTTGQTCYICHGEGDEDEGLVRGCACRGASGYAHVSCLARLAEDAGNRELRGAGGPGFVRWHTCGLCEQKYHGVVCCALGWACWKTYVGRPETDPARVIAMGLLGNALHYAGRNEDALTIKEAHLSSCGALANQKKTFSPARAILRTRMISSEGMKRP